MRPSSITHVRPASPNAAPDRYARTDVTRLGDRLGDDHALARREPVGLDDVQPGQRLEERERAGFLRPRRRSRGGRSGRRPRPARPSSTPSSPRAAPRPRSGRTPGDPAACTASTTPATSGSSGADHDEVGVELGREIGDGRGIGRHDRHALADRRHARVPGRADHFVDERRTGETPRERVLAAAGADDEDARASHVHAAPGKHDRLIACGADADDAHVRAGRTPRRTSRSRARSPAAPRAGRRSRSRCPTRAASRTPASPCATPTGGTARGRTVVPSSPS